jgi:serine/threonine protein kinase
VATPGTPFGRFNLVRKLAAGGMGEVFLAQMQGMAGFEKPVVIKRLLPQLASDRAFVDMFLDEARLAARLHHPNITQIFELGEVEGCLYLAMELVPGVTLEALLNQAEVKRARAPLAAGLRIALELLGALEYAHGLVDETGRPLELVHRDVSPANVMVTPHGGVKLLDFGLATFQQQKHQSETGVLKGKYGYMAPEQFNAGRIDRRADVFATGAILYHLATGTPAFAGDRAEVLQAMMAGQIPPARSRAPELAPALEEVLARAVARFPDDRFPDARTFREALEQLAAEARVVPSAGAVSEWVQRVAPPAHEPGVSGDFLRQTEISARGVSAAASVAAAPSPSVQSVPAAARVRRGWRAPAIAALAVVVGGGAVAAWRTMRPAGPIGSVSATAPAVAAPPPSVAAAPKPETAGTAPMAAVPAIDTPTTTLKGVEKTRPARAHRGQHAGAQVAAAEKHHEREVAALQNLYAALRKAAGEANLTGLEREAYSAALDAYAGFQTGKLSEADFEKTLADGSRILRSGAARRGLADSELPK